MDPETLKTLLEAAFGEVVQEAAGDRWKVTILKAGRSKNGNLYRPEVLAQSAGVFEGRPLMMYDLKEQGSHYGHLPPKLVRALKGGLVKAAVGVLRNVRWDEPAQALVGEAHITESWLSGYLRKIGQSGPVKALGLSINSAITAVRDAAGLDIQSFVGCDSVDVVTSPAAGGEFRQALEALADEIQEDIVDEKQIQEMIEKALAAYLKPEQIELLVKRLTETTSQEAIAEVAKLKAELEAERHRSRVERIVAPLTAKAKPEARDLVLKTVVNESKPDATDEVIRELGKKYADLLAPVTTTPRVTVVRESTDKMVAALNVLCGVAQEGEADGVAPFRGLREAYIEFTGDSGLEQKIAQEATQLTTTFTVAFGEAMHKRLRKAYNAVDFGERKLWGTSMRINDFKDHHIVAIGGLGDLPAVVQNNAYTEFDLPTEEAATLAVTKRGKILPLTWESIVNDDLNASVGYADKMGRAARRTLAKAVFAVLSGNGTIYDTKALFHADHANLGSSAFAYATLLAAQLAMAAQTEADSSEPLGINPEMGGLLIIPQALRATSRELLLTDKKPGSANNDASAVYAMFGAENERVVVNPFATDANDWFILADPMAWECINVGFFEGREEPEVLVADQVAAFSMWTKDVIEYKVRHIWGVSVSDYRPAYGAIVA